MRVLEQRAGPGHDAIDPAPVEGRGANVQILDLAVTPHGHFDLRLLHGLLERAERRYDLAIDRQDHIAIAQLAGGIRSGHEARDAQRATIDRIAGLELVEPLLIDAHVARREQRRIDKLRLQ